MKILIDGVDVKDDCAELSVSDHCSDHTELILMQLNGMSLRNLCETLFMKYATKDKVELQIGTLKFDAVIKFMRYSNNSAVILFNVNSGQFRIDL